jgi:hypothetical protein
MHSRRRKEDGLALDLQGLRVTTDLRFLHGTTDQNVARTPQKGKINPLYTTSKYVLLKPDVRA